MCVLQPILKIKIPSHGAKLVPRKAGISGVQIGLFCAILLFIGVKTRSMLNS